MSIENTKTSSRVLIVGCTAFIGLDSVNWGDTIPNIPDYDMILVSAPHMPPDFLERVGNEYIETMRKSIVRFLHSQGKLIALVSDNIVVERPKKYPEHVRSNFWCPINYRTPVEAGKSIVWRQEVYKHYLERMTKWSFYLTIPNTSLTDEITDFYGPPGRIKYRVPLTSYIENRYGKTLAGSFNVRIKNENSDDVHETGTVILLPLLEGISADEAVAIILNEEIGMTLSTVEPNWASKIEMPHVAELSLQVDAALCRIRSENDKIDSLQERIAHVNSFRKLLYGTGSELEKAVKLSLEKLGASVSPSRYGQEEYILEYDGEEFLMEVKGVTKSISLTHLRQLNDYLLKYEEDTGREAKGILFGNAWRNLPPGDRGSVDSQEFPDNVIRRAEQWGISLVSSTGFFRAFRQALERPELSNDILVALTRSIGLAFPPISNGIGTSDSADSTDSRSGNPRSRRRGPRKPPAR